MSAVCKLVLSAALLAGSSVSAAQTKNEPPAALSELTACRAVVEPAARLACYDREVAEFEAAEQNNDLMVLDRERVRQDRRSLFGLTLPRLALFDRDDSDEPSQIEGTITSVTPVSGGKWIITLNNGVWQTTEVPAYRRDPQVGEAALVKKAALGSFLLSINGRRGIRATRLR